MTIKNMRKKTGLTQKEFSDKYNIPLQTLKQWESMPGSSSYRTPPAYVLSMISRLIAYDFGFKMAELKGRDDYLIDAAVETRSNARHWFRYLRKEFDKDSTSLSDQELDTVLKSPDLTMFQKISLMRAATPDSPTHRYIVSLNQPANTPMLDEIMRKHA